MSGVSAPLILGFADRRDASGRYPVSDETGGVVASIEKLFARNQFVAYDGAGGLLGQGGLRVLGPWQAVDADGNLLARISRGAFGQHSVVLGGGWRGSLRGRLFSLIGGSRTTPAPSPSRTSLIAPVGSSPRTTGSCRAR